MAPVSTKTGFIWKPEEDTRDVQVILSKARGIHVDKFSSEDNTGDYSTYILEQRNKELGGFSTCVALEPDTYHFLFRVDHRSGKQELRTSGLYPNTFLASGRKVNYIEVAPLFSLVPLKPRTSKNESSKFLHFSYKPNEGM